MLTIRMNEQRERLYSTLVDVSDQGSQAAALDNAARFYISMSKENGILDELMSEAVKQGSLTPQNIADIVDTRQVPVDYSSEFSIGEE